MKKYICMMAWAAIAAFCLTACSDDEKLPTVTPSASGTMTDNDGNEYHWVRIGSLDWMTENLHCGIPFYEDTYNDRYGFYGLSIGTLDEAKEQFANYGNYYSWQEAMDNAPEGWRLPTDDDWKDLEATLGMKPADLDREGWRPGCSTLMTQKSEGTMLHFVYGGQICYYSWQYAISHDCDYGYYWTGTKTSVNGEDAAYARMFTPGQNAVNRLQILHAEHFLNVRYVRDAK